MVNPGNQEKNQKEIKKRSKRNQKEIKKKSKKKQKKTKGNKKTKNQETKEKKGKEERKKRFQNIEFLAVFCSCPKRQDVLKKGTT